MQATKRAEAAIQAFIQAGEPVRATEVGSAMEELLTLVRSLENRLVTLESAAPSPYSL